ncbi:MAG: hypothetical protein U0V70_07975 [Terriglobia bacterium]
MVQPHDPSLFQRLKGRRSTLFLAALTLLVLLVSVPGSLRVAYQRGGFYLFSREFLEDIPKRLAGPGKFRFVLQPLIAVILGIGGGRRDARAGRPPFLYGVAFHRTHRKDLLSSGVETLANLLLMGVLMDSIFQWILLGNSHPGAALVIGPVLIVLPYSLARSLSNHLIR